MPVQADLFVEREEYRHAERAVIASMLLTPETAIDAVRDEISADDFRDGDLGACFDVIVQLQHEGVPVDVIAMMERMPRAFSERYTPTDLMDLLESVPHAAHAGYYASLVAKSASRRAVKYLGSKLFDLGTNASLDVGDVLQQAETELQVQLERHSHGAQPVDIRGILNDALDNIGRAKDRGIPSGFESLDRLTLGFQPGHLIIVGARPSVGKTAYACNLCVSAARAGHGCLFVSLEQSRDQLGERILASVSRVGSNTLREGFSGLDPLHADMYRSEVMKAAAEVGEWPIYIDDHVGRTVTQIASQIRVMVRKHGVRLVVVDYLQLIPPEDARVPREQQVASMSRKLAITARQLNVPIVMLAQLNRAFANRSDKSPKLHDLRESGSLEQDANVVLLLDRPHTYEPVGHDLSFTRLNVAKNRDGETGMIYLRYEPQYLQFSEVDDQQHAAMLDQSSGDDHESGGF